VGAGAADPAAVRAYATFHCACRAADYLSDDFVAGLALSSFFRFSPSG
jgi:hypothetical protein